MEIPIILLIVFLIVVAVVTVVGHAIWLTCDAVIRNLTGKEKTLGPQASPPACEQGGSVFVNAQAGTPAVPAQASAQAGTPAVPVQASAKFSILKDLAATERQMERFRDGGKLEPNLFEQIKQLVVEERIRQTTPRKEGARSEPDSTVNYQPAEITFVSVEPTPERPIENLYETPPTFLSTSNDTEPAQAPQPQYTPPKRVRRRSFTEVLNSFMEESNIRWGEIIGGLLIIGCSTALVVSLWSQISQIPVLKFLIFTTVTAVLFGIGMYTEHRWKLPTTSRGILTIATLLVPLNFLAIAAVSSSDTTGPLIVASELLAPAIFLCLVYFAGRVITPGCAHLLAAGILGSSVGQLLVRHFATSDTTPGLLVFLGAFPVACYVVAVGLSLRFVLKDRKIDEPEISTVFTILGTMSFAALLPFGLLLHKSGPLGMSMMYLAPLVTLWGVPLLATGTVLWRRIHDEQFVASRTTGTALGILGLMIAIAGMILAWPNPASIIPAALLNFAILTVLAVILEIPFGHFLGAGCFATAYLVFFHVLAGNVGWTNLRVTSLVDTCLQISSGQSLMGAFAILLVVSEWLRHVKRHSESYAYLSAACLIAIISLLTVTGFGPLSGNDLESVWITYLVYMIGSIWIAWRRQLPAFTWIGSGLLLFTLASLFAWNTVFSFPFQTALLVHASLSAIAAIVTSRRAGLESLSKPFNHASLICTVLVVVSMFQTNPWQVTSMQSERIFWIAGILLLSLWLNRRQLLFTAFQIAVTGGVILTIKATLQQYEWYVYLPHAFMHPWALQIQGTILVLLSLMWVSVRMVVKKLDRHPLGGFWTLLDTPHSVDRLIPWIVLCGFVLLSIYGAVSGVAQEFAARGTETPAWNIAGFPHSEAFGIGSWVVLGLLAMVMLANAWERRQRSYLLGALITVATAIPLLAGRFEADNATATAWRFLAALFLLLGSVLLWARTRIRPQLHSFGWPTFDSDPEVLARIVRVLLLLFTVVPLLLFTLYPTLCAISLAPVHVPQGGLFALIDSDFSYGTPLVIVALVFIGYAIRERIPEFSFLAGLLFNATVTLAYVLSVVSANVPIDSAACVRLIQLNVITFSLYGLFWLSLRSRFIGALGTHANRADSLLRLEMWLAMVPNVLLIAPLTIQLVFGHPAEAVESAGSWTGWFSFAIACCTFYLISRSRNKQLALSAVASLLLSLVGLVAFDMASGHNANELRALTVGTTLVAWLIFCASYLPGISSGQSMWRLFSTHFNLNDVWTSDALHWSAISGAFAIFLSLRLVPILGVSDPWWTLGSLIALSALAAYLQVRTLRRVYLYAAGILLNVAVTLWWFAYPAAHTPHLIPFVETNIIVACLAGVLWLWLELRSRKLSQSEDRTVVLSYHNLVALCAVLLLVIITWFRIAVDSVSGETDLPVLTWLAWLATVGLMFSSLWDRHAKYATAGLYTLGLIAGAILFQQLALPTNEQAWAVMMFLATYALVTSLLWRKRGRLVSLAEQFGITARIEATSTQLYWLSVVSVVAVLTVGGIAYWINLRFENLELRTSAAIAFGAQALTLGFLGSGVWREQWRRAAIATLLIGLLLFGWSWLTPNVNATWLNRSVILMVGAFTLTALYGLMLDRIRSFQAEWVKTIGTSIPGVLLAGVTALLFCLSTEVYYQFNFGSVLINPVSLSAIGLTLVGMVVIPILFALSPTHDPLNLSETRRMNYVYAAEVMLALLFLHIRLTMPWLFQGFFEKYWPLVVMAVAYLGVAASESLRRRNVLVLATPIERTGAFLPLLPTVGFWLATSEVDYSSLLFIVGGLYGLLSLLRRSFVFGVLAAVTGNAGLWYLLHRTTDYQFLQHPQLWLIPVALSVLLGANLNEDRLTEEQMAGVRYLSLVTIYVSSTADIFINGVANSPWLPLILGAFSLVGVFSGIMFKIRGLLLLGSVFLLLAIVTMIWYASANLGWTWLWYVAGIATGATIIFMFAVFEKKRSEVLRVVEGLKDWEL